MRPERTSPLRACTNRGGCNPRLCTGCRRCTLLIWRAGSVPCGVLAARTWRAAVPSGMAGCTRSRLADACPVAGRRSLAPARARLALLGRCARYRSVDERRLRSSWPAFDGVDGTRARPRARPSRVRRTRTRIRRVHRPVLRCGSEFRHVTMWSLSRARCRSTIPAASWVY